MTWNTISLIYILIGLLLAELAYYFDKRNLASNVTPGAYLWILFIWPYVSYKSINEMLKEKRDAN